ncbi:MAG TPA: hypothetical protein VFG95_04315, partial [Nitrospiria bacterium]|nr:hypothetical protein [Nitrospiria bacterium]
MMNRKNLRIALTMIVLVLGGGCSGGDDNGSVGGSSNPPPNSPPPSNPAFSQDVPKTGGTVETPDGVVKLDFPQDALDGTTTITVNHLDGSAPPNGLPVSSLNLGDESVQDVVQFGPDGLDFAKPVRLTLRYDPAKLPSGTTPEMIVISKMREDGLLQLARNIQVDVVNHTVSGDISGFSTYVSAIDPRPPAACGYADETLNEDLLADNVTATSVTVSWTTTRP